MGGGRDSSPLALVGQVVDRSQSYIRLVLSCSRCCRRVCAVFLVTEQRSLLWEQCSSFACNRFSSCGLDVCRRSSAWALGLCRFGRRVGCNLAWTVALP